MSAPKKLMPEVAEKYSVLPGHGVGEYHVPNHGIVHLDQVDLAKADELVKGGFPYLVAKSAVAEAKADKGAKQKAAADKEA